MPAAPTAGASTITRLALFERAPDLLGELLEGGSQAVLQVAVHTPVGLIGQFGHASGD